MKHWYKTLFSGVKTGLSVASQVAPLAIPVAAGFIPGAAPALTLGLKIITITKDAVSHAETAAVSGQTKMAAAKKIIIAGVGAQKDIAAALGSNPKLNQIIELQLQMLKLAAEVQQEIEASATKA